MKATHVAFFVAASHDSQRLPMALGWLFFVLGQVMPYLLLKCVLLSIARVLPNEFSNIAA